MSEPARDVLPVTGRVLVVDDSLSVRRAIERMLLPKGLRVTGATDGGEALERLAAERPDLVICDVMLPEVDGYEVCRFVRRRPALAHVPVLLISGVSSPDVEERAAEAGAVGVLPKPFTSDSLLARIEGIVGSGPEAGDDEGVARLLEQARRLAGFRFVWFLDAERGVGRDADGRPAPPGLVTLIRQTGGAAEELGLGGPKEFFIECEDGMVVVHPLGRTALAVGFDRSVHLGLARHLVRGLVRRAPS